MDISVGHLSPLSRPAAGTRPRAVSVHHGRSPAPGGNRREGRCKTRRFASRRLTWGTVTTAITVRLDDDDHAELARQAAQLRVQPGTLARMLVHAGLTEGRSAAPDAHAAIDRLVRRSRQGRRADAVALVADARAALGEQR